MIHLKLRDANIVLFLLIAVWLPAQTTQNIKITGTVVNSTQVPIPYSSVKLTNTSDSTKVFGGLTDQKGHFNISITPGEYNITIDQAGFESYFDQKYLDESTSLGNLVLEQFGKEKEIDAVVVHGTPPIYKVQLDKKVYDVSQDITAKGGTLSDVMQNVPSLSVDVDGTVSLRGNDNVKILIDGKPSAMLGINDTGEALKMISADMIDKIEVVTNPSSRYQAEGTAGIINIITKKTKKVGLTGNISTSLGSPQLYAPTISLGYGKKNWNWFANAGFRYNKSKGTNLTRYSRFGHDGKEIAKTFQDGERERENTNFNFNTGFNINFDDNNSLTTSIGYKKYFRINTNTTNYNDILPLAAFSQRIERQHNDGYGIDGDLSYTHNFNKKGNVLTIDGNFNYTKDNSDGDIFDELISKNINNNDRSGFMLKSDYVLPLGKKKEDKNGKAKDSDSQLEAGVRVDYSKTNTDFSLNEFNNNTWIINPDFTDNTSYQENIFSSYLQYGDKIGDFSFSAGLRQETSIIKVQSVKDNLETTKNYTDFFPSLHLNYDLSEKSQLQLSYSRRISRPFSRFLIPYKNIADDRNTFQGNPNLNPSYTDSYELGFNMQYRAFGLTPSLYYQRINDPIQIITLTDAEGNLNSQPVNIGYENRYGGGLSYSVSPYAWWKIFGEFNFFKYENFGSSLDPLTGAVENLDRQGFTWDSKLSMNMKIPDIATLQIQGNYMAPREVVQNKIKEMYTMNLGISKDILKGQGTLLFNIQDVFNSRKRKTETFGEDFYRYTEMQWRPRQFTLTFTYRFNNNDKKRNGNDKRKNTLDNNQDMDDLGSM